MFISLNFSFPLFQFSKIGQGKVEFNSNVYTLMTRHYHETCNDRKYFHKFTVENRLRKILPATESEMVSICFIFLKKNVLNAIDVCVLKDSEEAYGLLCPNFPIQTFECAITIM